jgi:hypothetical protein
VSGKVRNAPIAMHVSFVLKIILLSSHNRCFFGLFTLSKDIIRLSKKKKEIISCADLFFVVLVVRILTIK